MISRMLTRRLFIAVNNPWLCSINDDPVDVCRQMDYIVNEEKLTDRLGLRADFVVEDGHGLFPMYKIEIHLEARGTKMGIDLGKIMRADVKDMNLILLVNDKKETIEIKLQTECEDLDGTAYRLKRKGFEIGNVMTYETDYKI